MRCELKEVLGKIPTKEYEHFQAIYLWMSLHNKRKPNNYMERIGVKATIIQIFNDLLHPKITPDIIKLGFISSWITLAYAVAGMTVAFVFAFVFGILASGILGFMRAIHELVWALGFATIAMLITVIPAARNVADGTLTLTKKWYRWLIFGGSYYTWRKLHKVF